MDSVQRSISHFVTGTWEPYTYVVERPLTLEQMQTAESRQLYPFAHKVGLFAIIAFQVFLIREKEELANSALFPLTLLTLIFDFVRMSKQLADELTSGDFKTVFGRRIEVTAMLGNPLLTITCLVYSLALFSFGYRKTAFLTLMLQLLNSTVWVKKFLSLKKPIESLHFKSSLKPIQTMTPPKTQGEMKALIGTGEKIANENRGIIDLSKSPLDDRTLLIYVCYTLSLSTNRGSTHQVNVEECPSITSEGISTLLKRFPYLTLKLTGTQLSSEEVYELQAKYPFADLEFDRVKADFSQFYETPAQSDCVFSIGESKIEAHSIILSCFGLTKKPSGSDWRVEGVKKEKFEEILKQLYRGDDLVSEDWKELRIVDANGNLIYSGTKKPAPLLVSSFCHEKSWSDVIVQVGKVQLPAHKAILAARSPKFAALLRTRMNETKSGIIDLTKTLSHPDEASLLLHYLYTGNIELNGEEGTLDPSNTKMDNFLYFDDTLMDLVRMVDLFQLRRMRNKLQGLLKNYLEAAANGRIILSRAYKRFIYWAYGLKISIEKSEDESTSRLHLEIVDIARLDFSWLEKEFKDNPSVAVHSIAIKISTNSKESQTDEFLNFVQKHWPNATLSLECPWLNFRKVLVEKRGERIEKLILTDKIIQEDSIIAIARSCLNLKHFSLPHVTAITMSQALLQLATNVPNLLSFDAPTFTFYSECGQSFIQAVPRLEKLRCKFLSDVDFCSLSNLRTLATVQVKEGQIFHPDAPVEIYQIHKSLTDSQLEEISQKLTLRKLILADGKLTDIGLGHLARKAKGLRLLSLERTIGYTGNVVQEILENCLDLRTLSLEKCGHLTDADFKIIFRAPTRLEVLNLSWCSKLTEETALQILKMNPCLQTIYLSGIANLKQPFLDQLKVDFPSVYIIEGQING